jgi:hypothetical protein
MALAWIGRTTHHSRPSSGMRTAVYMLDLAVPPRREQRAIAHILGTLDDKIELNRRMNETLEAMARALFRSWFVDFDPVRAKVESRDPGLPKIFADLIPARFVDSELSEIPEGWEMKTLLEPLSRACMRKAASAMKCRRITISKPISTPISRRPASAAAARPPSSAPPSAAPARSAPRSRRRLAHDTAP